MKRLLEGDGNEVEQGLLDALRLERPSPALEQRMRDALGLGPIPAAVAEPAAPPAAAAPAAKTLGWGAVATGALVAGLFVGGGLFLSRGGAPVDAPAPQAPREPASIAPPSEPAVAAPAPAVAPEPQAEDGAAERAAPKPRPQSQATPSGASLREEIRLIDSARVAVKNSDGARAAEILEQYNRRFPDGAFKEEARVLRSQALKKR